MITVTIAINCCPIVTRGARNTAKKTKGGKTIYVLDDGSEVEHDPRDGAIVLAKKLLDQVKPL